MAITALGFKQNKTQQRNIVIPSQLMFAFWTPGTALKDRLTQVESANQSIKKTADNEAKNKNEYKYHTFILAFFALFKNPYIQNP